MLVGDCFGRLQVAMKDMGLTLADVVWSDLPPEQAIEFFKSKKILTKKEFKKLSDAYKRKSFTVAGDHSQYTLEQMKEYITDAVSTGTTKAEFLKLAHQHFDAMGVTRLKRHHLETVFDTNVLGSYQHGRYQQQTTPYLIKRRPYWQYMTVGDSRVRESHKEMDGRVYSVDDPIWQTWYPPNGYRCRCRVDTLSQEELSGEGLEVETTGPNVQPDEGFAHSPKDWLKQ